MLRYVVLLALVVAVAQAIVCPSNFCDKVDCEDLTDCKESNGQTIRTKGSLCHCCDICVKLLGEGERCVPEGIFLGLPVTAVCAAGLYCEHSSRTCIQVVV